MKAGFHEADITPDIGMERPGGYNKRYIEAIHDPLKVRIAVFDDGIEKVALIGIDTCALFPHTLKMIRKQIKDITHINPNNVIIGASHTHTGGPLFGFHPDEFPDAPELIRKLIFEFTVNIDPDYENTVIGKIIATLNEADNAKEEVLLCAGSGEENNVTFNRRFRMKNGNIWTNPGQCNPDIIEPAGPIDPEVGVIGAWRKDGTLMGCVVNFTCHGTTFNGPAVSSDWIGYMEKTVKGAMGVPDAVTVFLNGACGDVTQWNQQTLRKVREKEDSSQFFGVQVGAEAVKVLVSAEKGELNPVKALNKTIRISCRAPSPDSIEKSLAIVEKYLNLPDTPTLNNSEWIFSKERIILDYMVKLSPETDIALQAIQVGPAVYLSMPGEHFCESGLKVKKASPFPFTWLVGYTGGIGYVPTAEAFGKNGGGYETVLTNFSNLEIDADEIIVKNSIELATQLTPGNVPEGPQLPSPGIPWTHGKMVPELN